MPTWPKPGPDSESSRTTGPGWTWTSAQPAAGGQQLGVDAIGADAQVGDPAEAASAQAGESAREHGRTNSERGPRPTGGGRSAAGSSGDAGVAGLEDRRDGGVWLLEVCGPAVDAGDHGDARRDDDEQGDQQDEAPDQPPTRLGDPFGARRWMPGTGTGSGSGSGSGSGAGSGAGSGSAPATGAGAGGRGPRSPRRAAELPSGSSPALRPKASYSPTPTIRPHRRAPRQDAAALERTTRRPGSRPRARGRACSRSPG